MAGGDLAVSFGLGANGLSDDLPFGGSVIHLLDLEVGAVSLGASPEAMIALMPDQPETTIPLADRAEGTIVFGDDAEATIQLGDDAEATIQTGDN